MPCQANLAKLRIHTAAPTSRQSAIEALTSLHIRLQQSQVWEHPSEDSPTTLRTPPSPPRRLLLVVGGKYRFKAPEQHTWPCLHLLG